jgi:hypothetical protein
MTEAQRVAVELGLTLVAPDTGPRSVRLPCDSESWDFGVAAAFTSTRPNASGRLEVEHEWPSVVAGRGYITEPCSGIRQSRRS